MTKNENHISLAGKYLTFCLGKEQYGVPILKVQEIIGMMPVTCIPRTPEYVRGVINLRGKVIPIIDLRVRFGMPVHDDTEKTCVIVTQIESGESCIIMGCVVDEVHEVTDVSDKQLEDVPKVGASINTSFILAIAKFAERVIMLLNMDKVLSVDETKEITTIM